MDDFALPLHVLVVVSRPKDIKSVTSYAKVEALYDALEAQGDQVCIEWLHPATPDALLGRLGDRNKPTIGVVYLEAAIAQGEDGWGICLENEDETTAILSVERLRAALCDRGVRLLILAVAERKGMDISWDTQATALAANIELPLIMIAPERTPPKAAQALSALFAALLAGQTLGYSISEAQRVWPSLAFYQQGQDAPLFHISPATTKGVSKIIRFPSPGLAPAWQRLVSEAETGGLPSEPHQGFHGRGRELRALERALWGDKGNGLVFVHGYEGIGKTTLVAHAARWLVRTGRFSEVVYTSFAGGGQAETALYDLGHRLLGTDFSLRQGDALQAIEQALRDKATLVIWDNLEAVLPDGEYALGSEALNELLQLGTRFASLGASCLIVISEMRAVPNNAYAEESVALDLALQGLDAVDAMDLLNGLWAGASLSQSVMETAELISALGGHPLALSLLADVLRERSVADLIVELERILPGFGAGEARLRNQALDAAMEAFLRSFDEDLLPKLFPFGLFEGGFMEPLALSITQVNEATWATFKKRLIAGCLIREVQLAGLAVPFIQCSATLTRHLRRRISSAQLAELEQAYCGSYLGLARWMAQNEERSASAIASLIRHELPNFRRALRLFLAAQDLDTAIDHAGILRHFLDGQGFTGESDRIANQIEEAVAQTIPSEGPLSRPGVQFMLKRGEQLLAAGRVAEAGGLFQNLCERMGKEGGLAYEGDEATFDLAYALHRLGRCLQMSAQTESAFAIYSQALAMLEGIEATPTIRQELLLLNQDLGSLCLSTKQWEQAETFYRQALEIAKEFQDGRAQGAITVQLADVALGREDLEQARQLLMQAIEHLTVAQDTIMLATVWERLGTLAWRGSDLNEAERCFKQALDLAQKAEQAPTQARIWTYLAQIAQQSGHLDDAQSHYAQAIMLYRQHGFKAGIVMAEAALSRLFLAENRLEDAKTHAEAAREAVEELGPEANPWEIYALLQHIAALEGDRTGEAHWRARAQESFAASPMAEQLVEGWQPLIQGVAQACRGAALDSETVGLIEKLESTQEWKGLAAVIWDVLSGARGRELYAELDHMDALIVRRILEAIEVPAEQEERTSDV